MQYEDVEIEETLRQRIAEPLQRIVRKTNNGRLRQRVTTVVKPNTRLACHTKCSWVVEGNIFPDYRKFVGVGSYRDLLKSL